MITLALWPTATISWNRFIRYVLASGLQYDGWHYENLSSRSLIPRAKCYSFFTNYMGLQGMGDAANISPRIPSTCAQSAILSLLIYTSFQVARSMWLLTIHCSFHPSPVLLLVSISGLTCMQPTIFPRRKTCKAMADGPFLTCTNFEMGCKLPEFSRIVGSARANQYSAKAPSSLRSLIFNSRCSCHGRRPFNTP